jgi:hypothetical protein
MGALGYFGLHAPRLEAFGYEPIPITTIDQRWLTEPGKPDIPVKDAGKQPAMYSGWQQGCSRSDWPRYAGCGVGILCRNTPALDIDVLDPEIAQAIQDLADQHLGGAPVRIGQPPKRLMPFQLKGEPFKKLRVQWRKGPAVELHPENKPPAVELLTNGQFVALGMHPGTGRPYEWHRDPDLSLPHGLLPMLDQDRAVRFMCTLTNALERIGCQDIKLTGIPKPETVAVDDLVSRKWKPTTTEAERVRAALVQYGNNDLHYDDWIRIGHAIKAALPGGDGLAIWEDWSAKSKKKNDPRLTRQKWDTFNPHTISAGTIFHLAREARR